MAFKKLEEDLSIIAKLPDEPNDELGLSAGQLKERFDKAGLIIRDYLNDSLLSQLQTEGGEHIGFRPRAGLEGAETLAQALEKINSKISDAVLGQLPEGSIESTRLSAGAVTEEKLSAASVSEGKIQPSAVSGEKIADGAVSMEKLAPGAVTGDKLSAVSVSEDKIAPAAVTAGKLADGAVSGRKIGEGAVQRKHLAPGAVGGAQLENSCVSASKLSGDIPGEKLSPGAVGERELREGAVTGKKIAPGAVDASKLSPGLSGELGGFKITELWRNSSPTSSFGAQTLSLNLSPYKLIIIECSVDVSMPHRCSCSLGALGKEGYMDFPAAEGKVGRCYGLYTGSSQLYFFNAFPDNNSAIPIAVYGLK